MSTPADDELVEVRLLLPRRALPAPAPPRADPELVSQENVRDLFGVPPRRFLEMVRSPAFPGRVLRIGKLRLVRREELLAHLHKIDEGVRAEAASGDDEPRPSLATRLGLEEAPAPARRRRA